MAEIIRKVNKHRLVENIQDIAFYSFDLNYLQLLLDLSNSTKLDHYLIRSWVIYLKSFLKKKTKELLDVITINKEISISINWGLRDYQKYKNISTFLTDYRYDREFSDISKRPFVVKYDNDTEDVTFYFKEKHYKNYIFTLKFLYSLINKNVNEIKSFIYSYYLIDDVDKKYVEESVDIIMKLLSFNEKAIQEINLVKEIII